MQASLKTRSALMIDPATGPADPIILPPPPTIPAPNGEAPVGAGATAFTHSGKTYVLGYGSDFFGIWERTAPGGPIERFPKDGEGWRRAWGRYVAMEPTSLVVRPASPRTDRSTVAAMVFSLSGFLLILLGSCVGIGLGYRSLRRMQWYPGVYGNRRAAVAAVNTGWFVMALTWLFYTSFDSTCVSTGGSCGQPGMAAITWGGVGVIAALAAISAVIIHRLGVTRPRSGRPPRPDA